MSLALLHRRLTLLMALAALAAFAAGAALPLPALVATAAALIAGLAYQPPDELGDRVERLVLLVAAGLIVWALYQVFVVTDDVVAPVVALLLVLLAGEALRSLSARNDVRLYTLSFALLVASTAYLPGVVFGVAFVAFVVLATLALMVGHLRRQAEQHGVTGVPIGRPFLTATAALSVVTLLMATLVFLMFPRLPRNIVGRGLSVPGASMAGFGEEVSLGSHGARIYPNPQVVLRVEFPELDAEARPGEAEAGAFYWRGRSYDSFDGVRWSRNPRRIARAWAPPGWYAAWDHRGPIVQRIYGGALDANVLFGLHPIVEVDPQSEIRPVLDALGDLRYVGNAAPIYRVESVQGRPDAGTLRRAVPGTRVRAPTGPDATLGQNLDRLVTRHYLALPPLPQRVYSLADSLMAGHATQYDRVMAVQRWLQTEFAYTLDLPATAEQATLEHFLFERRAGHCEYFSTALAVLLRSQGIPTRNVNGFLGGQWNEFGRYLAVTQNDAHSWVEVWFSGVGWVSFDATPAGTTAALARGESFLGPLRFALDGVQHRWNKWVIDYNLEKQLALFSSVGDVFSRDERQPDRPEAAEDAEGGSSGRWLLFAVSAALVLWLAYRLLRDRPARPGPASRSYLSMRRAYRRRGWAPEAEEQRLPALAWLQRLEAAGAPATGEARALVDAYLAARFGGAPADATALRERLRRIRRALRGAGDSG